MALHAKTVTLRNAILGQLERVDPPVTVRQLFYMVSSAGEVEKEESGYRKVQRQVLEMRRDGSISYESIADNTRYQIKPDTWNSLRDCLEETARFYRTAVWKDAPTRVEVWCEKDALRGVLSPVTREYDVPLMVCRGYSSETFAYEAADQIRYAHEALDKTTTIFYVGDMDPSGWDMARSLKDKLDGFLSDRPGVCSFERLCLTERQYRDGLRLGTLQGRPTKKRDSRARRFFEHFGNGAPSIEVEAVHPDELRRMVEAAIKAHIPPHILEAVRQEEAAARETLARVVASLGEAA